MGFLDRFKRKLTKPVSQKKGDSDRSRLASESQRAKFAAVGGSQKNEQVASSQADAPKKTVKAGVHGLGEMGRVLIGPVISEKATEARKANQYVFEVNKGANKSQIKKAFAVYYGVVPLKVNSIRLPGKPIRFGRTQGTTRVRRKVMVTLPKGKTIEI